MQIDPHVEWEYRGFDCQLYEYPTPDDNFWGGYVNFGGDWVEVIEPDDHTNRIGMDKESAKEQVETNVDIMIKSGKDAMKDNDDTLLDPIEIPEPEPFFDPNPDPNPFPDPCPPNPNDWGPHWTCGTVRDYRTL